MNVGEVLKDVTAALGLNDTSVLTRGGQKIVLRATLAGTSAVAKVVLVPDDSASARIVVERSHREVELLAAVDSPAVVRVLSEAVEIGDRPDAICWVEEFLPGSDLANHLSDRWPEEQAWTLASDLATALAACHELEVVHRDLSPKNVRRLPTGRYVLMDPGLARHLAKAGLTGHFQPGTPGWRSPEHVPGGEPVTASDIYCLGLLLYYALTGEWAISPNQDPHTYDLDLAERQAPSLREQRPDLSDDLIGIVDRCLQRQAARRYLDGTELLDELNNLGKVQA